MDPRNRVRALRIIGAFSGLVAVAVCAVGVWSVFYRATLVGRPFNFAWNVSAGCFSAEWLVKNPDGSQSAFGNPTFHMLPRDKPYVTLLPRYAGRGGGGTYRVLVIPLWPFALIAGLVSWRTLRRAYLDSDFTRCRACRYSRAGLDAAAPCPECGRPGFAAE